MFRLSKNRLWEPTGTGIVDVIALIHTFTQLPTTIRGLAKMFVNVIKQTYTPSKLRRVDFVADDYIKNVSVIKQAEQSARGTSERIEIRSLDSKTPDQFRDRVLKNPDCGTDF